MTLQDYLNEERGRYGALAEHLDVSISSVSMWARGKRLVPIKFIKPIQKWSGKRVTLRDIRPDIYG